MRLIDADALLKRIENPYQYREVAVWVNDMPTIEQKKGEWINAYPEIEPNPMFMYGICSVCGFEQSISDKLNFCPNCGADMRDKKDGNGKENNAY